MIEPIAWVIDDTGVPKYGKHSPGVKRQYSGTLGKVGSCQIAVALHAVSTKGTVPLGFRLYVPEDWCADPARRKETKIPASVEFARKPTIAGELVTRSAGWKIRRAPVLGDQAYGNDTKLRTRLHDDGIEYVLSIGPECTVFDPGTVFTVPERKPGSRGRAPSLLRADRKQPRSITWFASTALRLGFDARRPVRPAIEMTPANAITRCRATGSRKRSHRAPVPPRSRLLRCATSNDAMGSRDAIAFGRSAGRHPASAVPAVRDRVKRALVPDDLTETSMPGQ